jgi:hypothetical protein
MGHKLGSDAKTTYIQVNSLDNGLFVDEYAQPVIDMLDKFVFFNEDELKKLKEENSNKLKDKTGFISKKIEQGSSIQNAIIDYAIYEFKEMAKNEDSPTESKGYFDRI